MGNFELVKLGDICEFISGGTPSRNNPSYFQGNIPWITGADITVDVITSAREYITQEAIESSATKIVPKGNILLVTRTGVGKVAIAGVDICISQDFTGLLPNCRQVETSYLFRLLQASENYFKEHQRGATIQGVTRSVVKDLAIPLPPLAEQKRIAAILDQADALRVKRRAALARLDRLVQAVFLEMFGDPVTNPMGWEIKDLENVLAMALQNGAYYPKDYYSDKPGHGVEMVHMSDVFYEVVKRGQLKRVAIPESDIEKYSLSENDLLIARRSLTYEGAAKPCRIPNSNEPLIFESSLIRITPDASLLSTCYLYYYLSNNVVRNMAVFPNVTKSTISGINQAGLKRIKIMVPDRDAQAKFEHCIDQYQKLKFQMFIKLEKFDKLFHSLQQRAFRGEL